MMKNILVISILCAMLSSCGYHYETVHYTGVVDYIEYHESKVVKTQGLSVNKSTMTASRKEKIDSYYIIYVKYDDDKCTNFCCRNCEYTVGDSLGWDAKSWIKK